ncbi:MAG: hypothetical protein FXF47_04555 [Candidatus Mcinerneyibacterium aminivorans]|uniref:Uncharacterized protein n=1 Tax=Candidatus Mcinerneyibacterium aminivorans TaxID=2703815 RepID=A0A5D0MG11_9BACT|nr:MAG: hypothetical protein FXF47_04555 [Candidatus Mcinerneyibacterium aminivorans]
MKKIKMKVFFKFTANSINYTSGDIEVAIKKLNLDINMNTFLKQKLIVKECRLEEISVKIKKNEFKKNKSIKKNRKNNISAEGSDKVSYERILGRKFPFDIIINRFSLENINANFQDEIILKNFDINGKFLLQNNIYSSEINAYLSTEKDSKLFLSNINKNYTSDIDLKISKKKEKITILNNINLKELNNKSNSYSMDFDIKGDLLDRYFIFNELNLKFKDKKLASISSLKTEFDDRLKHISFKNMLLRFQIKNVLEAINDNFYRIENVKAQGEIIVTGNGNQKNYTALINFNNVNFSYKKMIDLENFTGKINLSGRYDKINIKNNLDFDELILNYKDRKESLEKMSLNSTVVLNNYIQFESMKLENFKCSILDGIIKAKGFLSKNQSNDLTLDIENLNFLKNFNIPVIAVFNGKLNIQGKGLDDIKLQPDFKIEDLDYRDREKNMRLYIPSTELKGDIYYNYYSSSFYLDGLTASFLENTSMVLNGSITSIANPDVNLTLSGSSFNLSEINKIYSGEYIDEMSGEFSLNGNFIKENRDIDLYFSGKFENCNYSYDNIEIKSLDGKLETIYNSEFKYSVMNMNVQQVKIMDSSFNYINLELPVNLNKTEDNVYKNNFFIENFNYRMYSGNKLEGIIHVNGKNIYLEDIYSNFMGGQIGVDFEFNTEKRNINLSLSGINLNFSRERNSPDKSEISFVSKIKGSKDDVEGFFDITKIDKDVLNDLLINLDPDKKNPQINLIRKKLNKFGVVPKKISIIISNGYVDIYPELGFRTKSIFAAFISFFVGSVEVEPIKKIPLEKFLKEINIE